MAPKRPDYGEAAPEDLARALLNAPPEDDSTPDVADDENRPVKQVLPVDSAE